MSRTAIHHPLRPPRRIRSIHGEPWHLRKTVGTNVSKEEHQLFRAIAESHGVSPSAYLRAMVVDVIIEEGTKVLQKPEQKPSFLKTA